MCVSAILFFLLCMSQPLSSSILSSSTTTNSHTHPPLHPIKHATVTALYTYIIHRYAAHWYPHELLSKVILYGCSPALVIKNVINLVQVSD